MIYLSAQPDSLYMKWQLEVQLFNFKELGIPADRIHVLIGFDPKKGLLPKFAELLQTHRDYATFFLYEDQRTDREYFPTIRPHIIKQHFLSYPELEDTCVFYHDADIIFRTLPDFETLCRPEDKCWYVSDTRSYINAEWIKQTGRVVLQEMCMAVGMDQRQVEQHSEHSGGAQYLMKGANYQYWHKVEVDSRKLYKHLSQQYDRYAALYAEQTGEEVADYKGVLPWCTDMWTVLWSAIALGHDVKIHSELDFCWPEDDLHRWEETKIFHNAGLDKEHAHEYFFKNDFKQLPPYHTSLDYVRKDKCTYRYIEAIMKSVEVFKTDLSDVTFLIPVRIDSEDRLNNLKTITRYLHKYFRTNIMILEADSVSKVDLSLLPETVQHLFVQDDQFWFHRTKYNNEMIRRCNTPFIALYDTDVIIDHTQLTEAIALLRSGACHIVSPYDGTFAAVSDAGQKKLFMEQLDIKILANEAIPRRIRFHKSWGGAILINKQAFVECGMENEAFYKWGPEDMERIRRMEILGYRFARIKGPLYHIDHVILHNSEYSSYDDYYELMQLQLDIISMNKEQLEEHIKSWS
ncbi:galactosyltransferase-related protein [Chitinophaga sp.]|uniref:galactosyltransferase-related protein n=1 Tax=Chitinophaga sp. TaxID=1869181 RepID=UPI0031E40840